MNPFFCPLVYFTIYFELLSLKSSVCGLVAKVVDSAACVVYLKQCGFLHNKSSNFKG